MRPKVGENISDQGIKIRTHNRKGRECGVYACDNSKEQEGNSLERGWDFAVLVSHSKQSREHCK